MDTTPNELLPQAPEAEKVVLGTLLSDSNVLNEIRDILPVESFYITRNQEIYQSILNVADRGEHIDIITVLNECRKMKMDIMPYDIAELSSNHSNFVSDHVAILVEKYKRRKLFELCAYGHSQSFSEESDINEVMAKMRELMDGVTSSNRDSIYTMRDAVESVYQNIDRNMTGKSTLTGSPTGFGLFDNRSGGLQTSDLIIIAADSSQGKTSLAIKLAMNCGCPVAFYSMEMKKEQIAARMISIESGVPSNEILYSRLASDQIQLIDKGVSRVLDVPVYFDDRSTSNIETILSSIRMMVIKYGIKGVIVDYLQILNVNMKGANKEQQMGDVARRLKNIAKELDIWVIALSQLSRDNQNPVPSLTRLRDSGQIAEAADMVILIYRPEIYGKKYPDEFSDKSTEGTAMIDVAKGRNIGLMKFIVGFEARTTNFYELGEVKEVTVNDNPHALPF
jgi:replicative DNA helicase